MFCWKRNHECEACKTKFDIYGTDRPNCSGNYSFNCPNPDCSNQMMYCVRDFGISDTVSIIPNDRLHVILKI